MGNKWNGLKNFVFSISISEVISTFGLAKQIMTGIAGYTLISVASYLVYPEPRTLYLIGRISTIASGLAIFWVFLTICENIYVEKRKNLIRISELETEDESRLELVTGEGGRFIQLGNVRDIDQYACTHRLSVKSFGNAVLTRCNLRLLEVNGWLPHDASMLKKDSDDNWDNTDNYEIHRNEPLYFDFIVTSRPQTTMTPAVALAQQRTRPQGPWLAYIPTSGANRPLEFDREHEIKVRASASEGDPELGTLKVLITRQVDWIKVEINLVRNT